MKVRALRASCALLAMTLVHVAGSGGAGQAPRNNAVAGLPYYNWTGMYVCGTAGFSPGHAQNALSDPKPTAAGGDEFGSIYGGLHVGYNYVLPSRFLLGVEAGFTVANFLEGDAVATGRATAYGSVVTDKVDFVSTVRGRVG